MKLLNKIFNRQESHTASLAKERLQIIVAHRRNSEQEDFIPKLQQELISVIKKYVHIEEEQVKVALEKNDNQSRLELNIDVPKLEAMEAVTE